MEASEHKAHRARHPKTRYLIWTSTACWPLSLGRGSKGFPPLCGQGLMYLKELMQYQDHLPSRLHSSSRRHSALWYLCEEFSDRECAWSRGKSKWTNPVLASQRTVSLSTPWFTTLCLLRQHTPSLCAFSSSLFCKPQWIWQCLGGWELVEFWLPWSFLFSPRETWTQCSFL